jgi:hypothetical protein
MKILLSTILLLTTLQTYAQFDYDLLMSFLDKGSLRQNSKLSSLTEFQLDKQGQQTKTLTKQFNKKGLPIALTQYDSQIRWTIKKEFIYGPADNITSIETYKGKEHQSSTEFKTNQSGLITGYIDYVYSSYDGTKTFVWNTIIEYNSNSTLKKIIKLQGHKLDTSQVDFFNTKGVKIKTLMNMGGLRTVKIEYVYNQDSTEMLEKHYEDATSIYNTIIHKYKDKKEIEKIDLTTSSKPFYWKYDDKGNVIETNEGFYYALYYKFNSEGYMTNKTVEVIYSDSDEKDLPKKIQYKYDYVFRQ